MGSLWSCRIPFACLCPICGLLYFLLLTPFVTAVASKEELAPSSYYPGDQVPVSCLNRTIDSGEHVQDKEGRLQYIPFAVCNETGTPLQLEFLKDHHVNCTIASLSEDIFHLLEFYIHHDSPLSCRIPMRPLGGERDMASASGSGVGGKEKGETWVPLIMTLAGQLETSHLHISTHLNLIIHTSKLVNTNNEFLITSAASYSKSPLENSTRLVIGDPMPLQFSVRWYDGNELPTSHYQVSTAGLINTRHNRGSSDHGTFFWCFLTATFVAFVMGIYYYFVDLPRRLSRSSANGLPIYGGVINGGAWYQKAD